MRSGYQPAWVHGAVTGSGHDSRIRTDRSTATSTTWTCAGMIYRRARDPRIRLSLNWVNRWGGTRHDQKDRMADPDHPLFGKAIANRSAPNSPLLCRRSDREVYFAAMGQRVDRSAVDGP